jgi:hypothetical protein
MRGPVFTPIESYGADHCKIHNEREYQQTFPKQAIHGSDKTSGSETMVDATEISSVGIRSDTS